ncbi:MAG TPA: PKD domain-containing protein [Conexibacter sp.]|nr:PKD domain-containing protein [Conexibacter sp.]
MLRAALLALSLILLAAASAPGASVTIAPSGGGTARTLTLGDLAGSFDVHGVAYTVRAADGTESTTTVGEGISLNALLAAAGLDADAFDYIALAKADGSSAIVMRDDLGGTGEGPPVVWSDADGVHFLRPSSGDGDANAADLVTLADGAPLALALKRGEPLAPRIAVSKLRVRPRERVDFSASLVGGAPLGPGLEYSWYFDGTGTVRGANVSHRFRRPGAYLVLLNVVRGDGTSIGDPDTVTVRVVRPRERRPDDARDAGEAHDGAGGGATAGGDTGSVPSAPAPAVGAPSAAPAAGTAPAPPAPERPRTPPGKLVSGTLLASASAAAPLDAPAAGRAASAAARGAATDGPLHVPVGVWAAVGLVALLALGWALESRHTLPFWQP